MIDGGWAASVDDLLRIRRTRGSGAAEPSYRNDARRSLVGRWVGRYAQSIIVTRPAWMDVTFEVRTSSEGEELFGKGVDGVGDFTMDGVLSTDSSCRLSKRYVRGHLVSYNGLIEDRSLHGVWAISASNYGVFALHHIDDLDRRCLPSPPGVMGRLWSAFFYSEPPFDAHRHQKLVDRFYALRPDLAHVGLRYP